MSKCEPYANQAKELTAAASVAVKIVRTISNKTAFRRGVVTIRMTFSIDYRFLYFVNVVWAKPWRESPKFTFLASFTM